MVSEPSDGLHEGLLLGELVLGLAQVGADGETVGDAAEQVDLPRLAGLDEDTLRLVAQLSGEDLVDFYGSYCQYIPTDTPLLRVDVREWLNIPAAAIERGP